MTSLVNLCQGNSFFFQQYVFEAFYMCQVKYQEYKTQKDFMVFALKYHIMEYRDLGREV